MSKKQANCDGFPGCLCDNCLVFEKECCGKNWTSWKAYRKHEAAYHAKKYGGPKPADRITRNVIVPDGLGYLTTVFTTAEKLATVSLSALTRYAAALNAERTTRTARFSKGDRITLKQLRDKSLKGLVDVNTPLDSDQAVVVYELAQAVNIPPKAVVSLLVSYGLELLSKELRNTHAAPAPKKPSSVVRVKEKSPTPRQEFLQESGVRTHEPTERVQEFLPRTQPNATESSPSEVQVPTVFVPRLDLPRVQEPVQDTPKPPSSEGVPAERIHSRRYIPRA